MVRSSILLALVIPATAWAVTSVPVPVPDDGDQTLPSDIQGIDCRVHLDNARVALDAQVKNVQILQWVIASEEERIKNIKKACGKKCANM